MLLRLASLVPLVLLATQAPVIACDDYPLSEKQRAYLDSLSLPYKIPADRPRVEGKFIGALAKESPGCAVNEDLNGDGERDFAGIFDYTGEELRVNDWTLDVVILFSQAGEMRHVVFPFAGQYQREKGQLLQYLVLHDAGEIDLQPGRLNVDYPAVASYQRGLPAMVYYWDGEQFKTRAMGLDD